MPADCDHSSSGESESEGSLGRSQEDPGSFVLQKRSVDKSSGHHEGNGMFASSQVVTGHMAMERPMMVTPGINMGMEYWSGPVSTSHEVVKPQYVMASAAGTMPYNGPGGEGRSSGNMWSQDDREQKREKRKQANRESARRSRMRKQYIYPHILLIVDCATWLHKSHLFNWSMQQFEYDELAEKVTSLTAENGSLKLEVDRLGELYKKLSNEKSALLERVQNSQS